LEIWGEAAGFAPVSIDHEDSSMNSQARQFAVLGAVSGFLAVALGAFGAHALKTRLAPEMLTIFETGVRYQMYHALALLGVAWACTSAEQAYARWSGWALVAGTVIFSGSLYALTFSGVRALGAITPLGGGLLLLGWWMLATAFLKHRR